MLLVVPSMKQLSSFVEDHMGDTAVVAERHAAVDARDSPGLTVGRTARVACDDHNSRLVDVQRANWGSCECPDCILVI